MKAAYIEQTGPAQNLRYGELEKPRPAAAQVLVRVKAVSVNPIDTYIRAGLVKMDLPMPFVVGCDLAGVVEEVGAAVLRFKAGDRVWASNQGLFGRQGTFSQYAAVDAAWLHAIPDGVCDEDAAAIALVGITAHLGLFGRARLTGKDTVFVHGGTGGVGSVVVQMAKAVGAQVITTGGTDEKVQMCLELGADMAVNYKTEDVDARIKQVAPEGVTLWWETLREPDLDRIVGLLAPRGRMVMMAGREARPELPVGQFYIKGCSLLGFAMLSFTPEEQRGCGDQINRWLVEGKLRAKIDRVMPLSEAAAAHQLQEDNTLGKANTLAGKIVLKPDDSQFST